MVRVYRGDGRWRVVVDGLAHFDVGSLQEVEPRARAVILDRLRAYLPDRPAPPAEEGLDSYQLFDLRLIRIDSAERLPSSSGEAERRAEGDSAGRGDAPARVTGRRC